VVYKGMKLRVIVEHLYILSVLSDTLFICERSVLKYWRGYDEVENGWMRMYSSDGRGFEGEFRVHETSREELERSWASPCPRHTVCEKPSSNLFEG
jgi:hypothetical protein